MSQIFDPSRNTNVGDSRPHRGFVTRLEELPVADAKYFGVVVFCSKDKHFYECQHVINETQDYYRWIAVTSGAERTFFIPVERLTDYEVPPGANLSIRSNCFDAIASAINEIALGLYRYNINTYPMGYVPCYDSVYVDGKKYYVWNYRYDRGFRTGYIITEDEQPIPGKPYYLDLPGYNEGLGIVSVRTIFFNEGESFPQGSVVYESARPLMIPDTACVAGAPITHKVFVSDGTPYDQLTKVHLVAKANEIVDIINMTHAKLDRATDDGTLYDLAAVVNKIIDEVNPFSVPWNKLLQRVEALESRASKVLDGELMPPSPTNEQLVEVVKKMFVALGGSIDGGSTPAFILNPDGTVRTQGEFNPDGTMSFDGIVNEDGTITVDAESESTH